jgi:nitrous oxide reductase
MVGIWMTTFTATLIVVAVACTFSAVVLPTFAQTGTGSQGQEEPSEESQVTNRTFFEFNTGIPAFNVTLFPPDQFSQTTLEVNQNDNVTVNFFNMEAPYADRHSFTINAPYKINLDLAPGQNGTLSFLANHPGIYQFYCAYHEPTMTGQLLVVASK